MDVLEKHDIMWVMLSEILKSRWDWGEGGGGGGDNKSTINKIEFDCWEGDKIRQVIY